MDFDFSPDTLMLRDMLRRFVQKEAKPLEMKYFNTGALTPEESAHLRQAIEQMGLWGITVPERHGGGGLDTVSACLLEEELGGTFIPVELGEVSPLLHACAGDQVKRFLEPALAGERHVLIAAREPRAVRPEAWQTSAAPEEGTFCLNGRKCLARRPGAEDFLVVLARHPSGPTAFLMEPDHPGLRVVANGELLLELRDCRLGPEAVLGEVGRALSLGAEAAPRAWIRLGARYVGLVERLIQMAAEHAQGWVALGAPLAARPAVQRLLADMRVEVESARWLVYHAAWLADRGDPIRAAAAQVRLATGAMLQHAIDSTSLIYTGPGPANAPSAALGAGLAHIARSPIPPEAMQLSLENARAVVAATLLATENGR